MKGLHGLIFADGRHAGLRELTEHRAAASVPFGGRYRMIDFVLSNMVNAGVHDVGVILGGNYQSLLDHLGSGKDWDLSRKHGGLRLLPPFNRRDDAPFRGRMEALAGVMSYLENIRQDHVVLADSNLIVNMPLQKVYEEHMASGADITVVCTKKEFANMDESTFLDVDENGFVTEAWFDVKKDGGLRDMNIYVMSKELLLKLTAECRSKDLYSFRHTVLQGMKKDLKIKAFVWDGYAARVRTLSEYYQRSMELFDPAIRRELFPKERPIYTKEMNVSSTYIDPDGKCVSSLVADGCTVEGSVENCIIFRGVSVAKGASVKNCILMQGVSVGKNARLECIVADKNVKFTEGCTLIGSEKYPMAVGKNAEI